MSPRVSLLVVAPALLLALLPDPGLAADLPADTAEGRRLLAEGDELADMGKANEAVACYKKAFEQLLPGMRKVAFKHEVKQDVTAREAMSAFLIKEIDADTTPAEFRGDELGMKALGFIPRDFDLKAAMVKIYSEEIAAFYDTKTKTMHMIKEPEGEKKKPRTFLERLLGKKEGFDKDENKVVIAHELTHALADQNFDIDKMQKTVKHDDDRDLALSALVEGEATLTMIGADMQDWNGSKARDLPAASLRLFFTVLGPLMPMAGGASLREAPVILSETMIFPYFRGVVFCAHLTNTGGWKALDGAYRHPPLSTEQILHPEKYSESPDLPTAVDLGTLDAGPGWKEVGRNVVGEMQLAVLLRRHGGKIAAEGWDGDRFAVFEREDHRLGLVWFSTWDSVSDAEEFARGYKAFQKSKGEDRLAPQHAPEPPKVHSEEPPVFSLERRGVDVAVVEGFTSERTRKLIETAFQARKSEIRPAADAGANSP